MFPASLPQLSLGSAALIIFALCAGFVLLRGMTRMLVGTVVLGASAWIGFRVWQLAPAWSVDWTGKSLPWINNGLPVAAFLVSFLVIRWVINAMVRPFSNPSEKSLPRSFAGATLRSTHRLWTLTTFSGDFLRNFCTFLSLKRGFETPSSTPWN
ncbi:hypothetical protein HQ447_11655, partial [bacterium]|nr:hypothetical protein [bacterium]